MFSKIIKNDEAVSPIVATLVLIVVAIIGAAAVGLLMGSFSSNVSDQMSTGDTSSAASTELLTAGSTSVEPLSDVLAEKYMAAHPGIKVTVSGGGSGVGKTSTALDVVDLGASSSALSTDEQAKYPNLQQHEIGGSAVIVVTNAALNTSMTGVTASGLNELYTEAVSGVAHWVDADTDKILDAGEVQATGGIAITVYQRSEESGTEETFAGYLGEPYKTAKNVDATTAKVATGNSGMVTAVAGATSETLGFIDYGFMGSNTGLKFPQADGKDPASAQIINALKGQAAYPAALVKHLYYLTNGNPSTIEQSFIDFAKAPTSMAYFTEAGVISQITYS